MNKLDKLIAEVFPRWAEGRAISRHNLKVYARTSSDGPHNQGGYRGGQGGRLRSLPNDTTASEDNTAAGTYSQMIANAMALYRNDPMTKSVVDVSSTYLGESRPTATTSDPEWNVRATEWFNDFWWKQADARNRSGVDFGQMQILFDKWQWIGGDMLFVPMDGRLLPYEGIQIQTPSSLSTDKSIVNGIRIKQSAPWPVTHYYITQRNKDGKQIFQRIRASEAIYAGAENWRFAMLRSVPDLHGVIDAMHAYRTTEDNVQKKIEFESGVFTKERKGSLRAPSRFLTTNEDTGETIKHTKADWGQRFEVNGPIDDFDFTKMENPGNNYVPTMEHMARAISAGTGFPYEIVMHIYTSGSYTANRAARLDFAKALMSRWAWRNKVFNQRVWNWRIAKAIKEGDLPPAPVDAKTGLSQWHRCTWSLPHFPHIDEGKEVKADIDQWGCAQESISDWAQQKGMTRDQMLDAHDKDIEAMQARAEVLGIPLEQYASKLFTASAAPEEQPPQGNRDND